MTCQVDNVRKAAPDAEGDTGDRTLVYEGSETFYLVHMENLDPRYSLDTIVADLAAGRLWLENATAGDSTVRAADAAKPEGRIVAVGLVERDFEDVRTRNYRSEFLQ